MWVRLIFQLLHRAGEAGMSHVTRCNISCSCTIFLGHLGIEIIEIQISISGMGHVTRRNISWCPLRQFINSKQVSNTWSTASQKRSARIRKDEPRHPSRHQLVVSDPTSGSVKQLWPCSKNQLRQQQSCFITSQSEGSRNTWNIVSWKSGACQHPIQHLRKWLPKITLWWSVIFCDLASTAVYSWTQLDAKRTQMSAVKRQALSRSRIQATAARPRQRVYEPTFEQLYFWVVFCDCKYRQASSC